MKVLYIGQYSEGTTSKMRGEVIRNILKVEAFEVIDIHEPFYRANRWIRSFGFRFKKGPLIKKVNQFILKSIDDNHFDLIWVDKAIFISPKTTRILKTKTPKLVHFTPDPAFTFHQSELFFRSISYYDYVITTKSYELKAYHQKCKQTEVLFVTQGFDKDLHQPSQLPFDHKQGFAFLGHHEKERENIIELLLNKKVNVTLAGINWGNFAQKHQHNKHLNYLGQGVYGENYVKTLQDAKIAWGAISKWVKELHTTRTFEIPACGTALLTERNSETSSFFKEDEALFYDNEEELVNQVLTYMKNDEDLKKITGRGRKRVLQNGYDYTSILQNVLNKVLQ